MLWGLFAMLSRLWVLLIASFRETDSSVLPTAMKVPAEPQIGLTQASRKNGLDTSLREPKGQFLRHPSLGPKRRVHHIPQPSPPERRSDKGEEQPIRAVNPTFTIQDWSSLPAKDVKPPHRPPRPPSGPLPAVVITPCSPMVSAGSEGFPFSAPRSPLERTIASYHTSPKHLSPDTIVRPKFGLKDASETKQIAQPSVHQRDTTASKVVPDAPNPFIAKNTVHPSVFTRGSFVLPESLRNISFQPSPYNANALSAVSERLWDAPSWVDRTSTTENLNARTVSYVTSTPAKKRRANEQDPNESNGSPSSTSAGSSPRSVPLSDDQIDLPYPDVFDLDMYYGVQPDQPNVSRDDEFSSSQALQSFKGTQPLSSPLVQLPGADLGSPKSAKRLGFVPESPIRRIIYPGSQEAKRYRDHRRQPVYSRPPQLRTGNTSLDSDSSTEPKPSLSPSRRSRVLTPLPPGALNAINVAGFASPQPLKAGLSHRAATAKRDNQLSPIKERVYTTPPVVIVSHHRFDSLSEESQYSSSDSESQDALRAGLKEAYDNFSKTVWTDGSYSIEAVSVH